MISLLELVVLQQQFEHVRVGLILFETRVSLLVLVRTLLLQLLQLLHVAAALAGLARVPRAQTLGFEPFAALHSVARVRAIVAEYFFETAHLREALFGAYFEEFVFFYFFEGRAEVWLQLEDFLQQLLARLRYRYHPGEGIVVALDFFVGQIHTGGFEWALAHEHRLQNYAERPHVTGEGMPDILLQHLGRHLVWRAYRLPHDLLLFVQPHGHPEVRQL